jgi:hypothetical protein
MNVQCKDAFFASADVGWTWHLRGWSENPPSLIQLWSLFRSTNHPDISACIAPGKLIFEMFLNPSYFLHVPLALTFYPQSVSVHPCVSQHPENAQLVSQPETFIVKAYRSFWPGGLDALKIRACVWGNDASVETKIMFCCLTAVHSVHNLTHPCWQQTTIFTTKTLTFLLGALSKLR